jgi:hypothetical protein
MIQQEEGSFHQHIGLEFKAETSKVLHLEHMSVWSRKLDLTVRRSEIPGRF